MNIIQELSGANDVALGKVNPLYEELGELAKQIVIQTMIEGEKTHPDKPVDGWKDMPFEQHVEHINEHVYCAKHRFINEDHIAHALTHCAMIKYLSR